MKRSLLAGFLATALATTSLPVAAATEIQWWHAFTGRLGELLAEQVEAFNASQSDYKVVASHKGNYSETLNAGIAAFRAEEQPHILMVFEVGTATMMGAKGAIMPVHEVMKVGGAEFDPDGYLGAVKGITQHLPVRCCLCRTTHQHRYCMSTATHSSQLTWTPIWICPPGSRSMWRLTN